MLVYRPTLPHFGEGGVTRGQAAFQLFILEPSQNLSESPAGSIPHRDQVPP